MYCHPRPTQFFPAPDDHPPRRDAPPGRLLDTVPILVLPPMKTKSFDRPPIGELPAPRAGLHRSSPSSSRFGVRASASSSPRGSLPLRPSAPSDRHYSGLECLQDRRLLSPLFRTTLNIPGEFLLDAGPDVTSLDRQPRRLGIQQLARGPAPVCLVFELSGGSGNCSWA